ncbi:SRPBCC family protein [Propionibacteriaceae bacterium Y2011]
MTINALRVQQATIEADAEVPVIRITRDFTATPAQLVRAHTDPDLYAQWCGPHDLGTEIDHWDARSGGSWAFTNVRGDERFSFHGCFHEIGQDKIVQTFTYDEEPDGVSLETLTFQDLGDGRTRLVATSLVDSFEARDGWLVSGMETGVNDGYEKLDALLAEGRVPEGPAPTR